MHVVFHVTELSHFSFIICKINSDHLTVVVGKSGHTVGGSWGAAQAHSACCEQQLLSVLAIHSTFLGRQLLSELPIPFVCRECNSFRFLIC